MLLTFEPVQEVGAGNNPTALHTPENIFQVIYVGPNGNLYAIEASTPMGNWQNLEFSPTYLICTDVDIEHLKLKHVASSIFVVWKNDAVEGEVVPYQEGVVHTLRHRLAVWAMRQDLSKYLVNGDVEFRLDDPVVKLSLELENPKYVVSGEDDTILTPGTSITLFFRAGDSARYIMGRYFIDRNSMGVDEETTSVDARNAIGKLLKDQTFDDDCIFLPQTIHSLGEAILQSFGVINYYVGESGAEQVGMMFPEDMNGLEGMQEVIKTNLAWKLEEDISGRICFADASDSIFAQPGTYTFYRGQDIFSRKVERDDADAYSRVCVYTRDRSVEIYKDVVFQFVMGRRKTLHVAVPDGTLEADADAYATELAGLVANVGTIETFSGPFRPHIWPGDNAVIIGRSTRLLGLITSVHHRFGRQGFKTDFTVDSGSVANKTRVGDYIKKITGKASEGQATRLYFE